MTTELDNLDRRPLYTQVAEGIATMIKSTGLTPGDSLPSEAELGALAGVSRVVVRGALAQLAGAGLIRVSNGRRAQVMSMDASVFTASLSQGLATAQFTVSKVLEVRNGIETSTAALAAENRTEADIIQLESLFTQMQQAANDSEAFAELDYQFHLAVAEATGNPLYVYIVRSLRECIKSSVTVGRMAQPSSHETDRILSDHLVIQRAIAAGSIAAATEAMQKHFDATNAALTRDFAPQNSGYMP